LAVEKESLNKEKINKISMTLGSRGGEYEDGRLLVCSAV
jgi:hypothetical protein